jgi:hypothetical protein
VRAQTIVSDIPCDYRGILFHDWLDIFLEYSLCLAKAGKPKEAYDICSAAKDAYMFYNSTEDMFLIYVCWCCTYQFPIRYPMSANHFYQLVLSLPMTRRVVYQQLDISCVNVNLQPTATGCSGH